MWLKRETSQKERIDAPAEVVPFDDYRAAFFAVGWTNRHLGGTAAVLRPLDELVRRHRLSSVSILDVGCGGADIDLALADWAKSREIGVRIIGIDSHPHAVRLAREQAAGIPEIDIVHSNFFESKFSEGNFDFVIGSLLLHHLAPDQLSYFLWKAYRLARVGVVLTDLRRNWLSYWAAKSLVPKLAPRSDIFRHDAALSFRRAYTLREIRRILAQGGYPYMATMPWRCPFRLTLIAERLQIS